MNVDPWRLFRDIATTRNFSRAAEMNGISQSAASQHIQELERQLEVQLVDRSKRPLVVTEAGRLYQEYCRESMRLRHEFEIGLEQLRGTVEGVVRVSCIYSVGFTEVAALQEEYQIQFPEVELRVEYLRPEKIYDSVLSEKTDLGLISYPEQSKDMKVIPWRQERMSLAVAASHPLARLQRAGFDDLRGQTFVGFDTDLPIARDIARYLREGSADVKTAMRVDNIQMLKEAVIAGVGIAIMPDRLYRQEAAQGRLARVELCQPLFRPLGILHLRKKKLNRATQAFLNLLIESHSSEDAPEEAAAYL